MQALLSISKGKHRLRGDGLGPTLPDAGKWDKLALPAR
jgi:hypothetical protein